MLNAFEEMIARRALKPQVIKTEPGVFLARFASFKLLPKGAVSYLSAGGEVLASHPAVYEATIDQSVGEVRLRYDPSAMTPSECLKWVERVIDETLRYIKELDAGSLPTPQALSEELRRRLAEGRT